MDQGTARQMFENGAFLVVLDASTGIEFGIDLDTWETGPLFKGLKMIPPGIHYIHYSAVNNDKQAGIQSGFLHSFVSKEVVVRRWCAETEQLYPSDHVSAEDVERIRMGIRDLDKGLGAYPHGSGPNDSYARWQKLTGYITPAMLALLLPPNGEFSSATGSVYEDEEMEEAQKALHHATAQPAALSDTPDRFNFTHTDIRRSFPANASPEDVRKYSQDKSWLLKTLLSSRWHDNPDELLGELQLAFVIIFVGQNFSGLEHWKLLMHLTLCCAEALEDRQLVSRLFVPLVRVLCVQLAECPQEFAASVLEQDNFIAVVLETLVLNVYECSVDETRVMMEKELVVLRKLLEERFSWTLATGRQLQADADAEDGEYAPQVVHLD
ncbi:hypothetical protein LPJ53_004022 [Coemansia erecta]|uniref:AAR2-domain-containing protein n=1 Tax=Coemansia erecta TaxID=147472 RepID=A0A9W7XYW3_9FUNG|nr:hypothetical protein LPJ53_004022 [Coemansia erecta]